jgi:hypothetical protein
MALKNDPVFVQTPKAFSTTITSANTNLDGTGTITTLYTAGSDGTLITSLRAFARATVTATALRLFLSLDGGTTWVFFDEKLMSAYTIANTTAQTPVTFVDKTTPDAAIRLPASAKIGATIAVALAGGIAFCGEAVDY